MKTRVNLFLKQYYSITISFLFAFCLIRVFEYYIIAAKFFVQKSYQFELVGLLYDIWAWLIYCVLFFAPFLLFYCISKSLAKVLLHIINVVLLSMYLALIIVFSERNTPFDHEFFTRSFHDSWLTTKQMMASGFTLYLPFIISIFLYFLLYFIWFRAIEISKKGVFVWGVLAIVSVLFIKNSNPPKNYFKQPAAYYLACNKFSFWLHDTYNYFTETDNYNKNLLPAELAKEIDFYQAHQPFQFSSKEYPLMHENTGNDVLGSFFNLHKTPPNIVILVVEGLSRDFSGDNAYASSFTPFLDSLSAHSLVWNNFLSTAPGTFAAQPAITASVPYAARGFSLMNEMPNHLSLIKLLKNNGYWTNFMIGFNPDFDNMGGYIRMQGTDFVLSNYPSKYKQMGIGEEGWSMGYPDDALFNRSFEVMDSIKKYPYLNIYHTATTHMPYLFAQKPVYDKLFDKKIAAIHLPKNIKRTLQQTKDVLVTYMFSDDCIRNFFSSYEKREDFNNTIFFITGDHHIGSFPSTCGIDDYHVPLIIYSSMLKSPKKFLSVNTHNNLTPTIASFILHNYSLPYQPKEVHWLCDVMDTCTSFRNIHSMPFMEWSREITDYIYKDYYLSGNQLFKLTPDLLEEDCNNDSIKQLMIKLRNNFKIINQYVCDNNKLFPAQQDFLPGKKELLFVLNDTLQRNVYSKKTDIALINSFKIPAGYDYLYVEVLGSINSQQRNAEKHLSLRLALVDTDKNNKNYVYWSMRDIAAISTKNFMHKQWNKISTNDMFTLKEFKKYKNLAFDVGVWTDMYPINFQLKNLQVKVYGVKNN